MKKLFLIPLVVYAGIGMGMGDLLPSDVYYGRNEIRNVVFDINKNTTEQQIEEKITELSNILKERYRGFKLVFLVSLEDIMYEGSDSDRISIIEEKIFPRFN